MKNSLAVQNKVKENHHVPMTVDEVCTYLGISKSSFYYKVKHGGIPVIKQGKHLFVYRDELDKWLETGRKVQVPLTFEEEQTQMLASITVNLTLKTGKAYGKDRHYYSFYEELTAYMEESAISVKVAYEHSPVVLMVDDTVIGTLGNFSASIGKAKSKKTFNVSAIVASALNNSTVLNYRSYISRG